MKNRMKNFEECRMEKLTWDEVNRAAKENRIVLLPIGSTEQHGYHLPLDTDTCIAYEMAYRAALQVGALVAPALPFGESSHHMGFSGTITLRSDVFVEVVKDILKSLIHHGFRRVVIVNGHGGNSAALSQVISDIHRETGKVVAVAEWFRLIPGSFARNIVQSAYHSDETETSLALAVDSMRVRVEKAVKEVPKSPSRFIQYDLYAPGPKITYPSVWFADKWTSSGVVGDPIIATREKGQKLLEHAVENLVTFLREIEQT